MKMIKRKKFDKNVLRSLKGKIKIYKIASYDIETDMTPTIDNYTGLKRQLNTFLFGGFIDTNGKYKCFKDKDKMIDYMVKHCDKDTMCFATNNGFDHYALFGHKEDFLKDSPLMRGNLLMNAKYKTINTFDTRSYYATSVKSLGIMLGKPKGDLDEKYMKKNFNKELFNHLKRFRKCREYNKRDCEITREFMIGFQKVLNEHGGNLKMTIGSSAMDLFKRKFLKEDIEHEKNKHFSDGTYLKDFLSLGYHGGRTETFKRKIKNTDSTKEYYYYDFNSLYPSCMLLDFPKPSSCHLTSHKYGKLNVSSILNFEGVSEVEVFCPYMDYPILPTFVNKKLCFCVGKFRGVFTHVELRKLLQYNGRILKIYKTVCYTKTFSPFKEWVTQLYDLRLKYAQDGNEIYKGIIKLLLNNLYGKFFQRNIKNMYFIHINKRNDEDLSQDGFTFDRELGFGYKETPKESNQSFIIPIIAVYVTAYARMKLFDKLVELKGLMCDTDSILSDIKIDVSNKLGELKQEYNCEKVLPYKPKVYKLYDKTNNKWVYRAKGIKLGKTDEEKEENFNKLISNKPIGQDRYTTIKEAIRSGGKFSPNEVRSITKVNRETSDKRSWLKEYDSDGMELSKPIILGFKNYTNLIKYQNKLLSE